MPTFEHTIDVTAPADHVFEFMTDTSNWLRTHAGLVDHETISETGEEIRMHATYRMLGIPNHLDTTQRIVEPGAHSMVSFESPGLIGEMDYRFTESDGVTTVVESADYEFGDSLRDRIIEPVGRRYNERQFRHSLENMKELMNVELATDRDEPIAAA